MKKNNEISMKDYIHTQEVAIERLQHLNKETDKFLYSIKRLIDKK